MDSFLILVLPDAEGQGTPKQGSQTESRNRLEVIAGQLDSRISPVPTTHRGKQKKIQTPFRPGYTTVQ